MKFGRKIPGRGDVASVDLSFSRDIYFTAKRFVNASLRRAAIAVEFARRRLPRPRRPDRLRPYHRGSRIRGDLIISSSPLKPRECPPRISRTAYARRADVGGIVAEAE